jgi:hypothetical protein
VCDVRLPEDGAWAAKHLRTLGQAYARAPFAGEHLGWLERFLLRERPATLSELNQAMIIHVARDVLGLQAEFSCSSRFALGGSREDRLLDLLGKVQDPDERELLLGALIRIAPLPDNKLNNQQKRELLDWTIRPALRTVPGVADVNALGGYVRTFEVRPDPAALGAAGPAAGAAAGGAMGRATGGVQAEGVPVSSNSARRSRLPERSGPDWKRA